MSSGNVQGTKGYRMVSVELYEGKGIDDKTGRYVTLTMYNLSGLLIRGVTAVSFSQF